MLKSEFINPQKENRYVDHLKRLNPFKGVGDIINEHTNLTEIKRQLGQPEYDITDERDNRILEYPKMGLSFKFLNILNDNPKNPKVSFITIKKPFVDNHREGIYPGLERIQVYFRLEKYQPLEAKEFEEIWKNENGKKMKLIYDKSNCLESITFF